METTMKLTILALATFLLIGSASAQTKPLPCANVYVSNDTIVWDGVVPVADQIALSEITRAIQQDERFCFKGLITDLTAWQVQKHDKTDVLLVVSLGTLGDGGGVGDVGNKIEVVAYNVFAYDKSANATVSRGGPEIVWFAISKDDKVTRQRAHRVTVVSIVYAVGLFSNEGRNQ
jgi:hypothetical protein